MTAIPLDRRQTLAASLLMAAVDWPQQLDLVAELWIKAAELTPGCTVDELLINGGRRVMLSRARDLIDEMLAE